MNLRAKIQEIIDKEPTSEQAAIKICILLEDKFGLNSHGWCDDDGVVQEGDSVKIKREISIKTLFTTEEKAIFNKETPASVRSHSVDKQLKPLKTLFTEEEKAALKEVREQEKTLEKDRDLDIER